MFDLNKIIRPNIHTLKPYSSARDEFSGKEGVFLDANENPFGELNRYPDPHQNELKKKLAQLKGTTTENIFIGNGSDEVIDLAFKLFCNPGIDKALIFSPTYGMYEVSANINNIELIKLPLNNEFQINIAAVTNYLFDEQVKLIFICSPNNPTGNCINTKDIEFILVNFQGVVMIDEAYIDFSEKTSWLEQLNQYSNLIVIQTFSKAWGLAAARVGIAYSTMAIIQFFTKVKPPYNVSLLNQQAAIDALSKKEEFEKNKKIILTEKRMLEAALRDSSLIKRIYPSDANFLLVEVIDANQIYSDLVRRKIITRNRHSVIYNCIRITVGSPEENQALINALREMSK
ncbi:MAG: histidinol-phosphate transaminase [Ignavibacteriae bacterium]|nr:histidinol-phosphate transaminase [Ignavibacteriota bacterium]